MSGDGLRGLLDACVHCGFCLPACPTYRETGDEGHSPRGRLALVRALVDGADVPAAEVAEHLDACLGCRACEPACPSDVAYGSVLESARATLRKSVAPGLFERTLLALLGSAAGISFAMRLAWIARRVPGAGLVATAARLAPDVSWTPWSHDVAAVQAARGTRRGAVALLPGCVTDHADRTDRDAVVRVLNHAGWDVHVPGGPLCCGALHAHRGDTARAERWIERLAAAVAALPVEALVTDTSGCGAHLLTHTSALHVPAYDALAFVAERGLPTPPGPVAPRLGLRPPVRVVWDAPCHLAYGQRRADAVQGLLAAIPDVDLVTTRDGGSCCGSAGLHNVLRPADGRRLGAAKAAALLALTPDLVVTANAGCRLQIEKALRAEICDIPVRHAAWLLAQSFGGSNSRLGDV